MSRQTDWKRPPAIDDSPVRPTRINPDKETLYAKAINALSSRDYIVKFTQSDVDPVTVTDEASQARRDAQIVALCRRITKSITEKATDLQVLRLHHAFMGGRL